MTLEIVNSRDVMNGSTAKTRLRLMAITASRRPLQFKDESEELDRPTWDCGLGKRRV
jgi:hypothetical protein